MKRKWFSIDDASASARSLAAAGSSVSAGMDRSRYIAAGGVHAGLMDAMLEFFDIVGLFWDHATRSSR